MRRELPTIILLGSLGLVLGLSGLFYLRLRPELLLLYRELPAPMPRAPALALGPWLLPATMAATTLGAAAAFVQKKRSARLFYLAAAVTVGGLGFVGCALVAYGPLVGLG